MQISDSYISKKIEKSLAKEFKSINGALYAYKNIMELLDIESGFVFYKSHSIQPIYDNRDLTKLSCTTYKIVKNIEKLVA